LSPLNAVDTKHLENRTTKKRTKASDEAEAEAEEWRQGDCVRKRRIVKSGKKVEESIRKPKGGKGSETTRAFVNSNRKLLQNFTGNLTLMLQGANRTDTQVCNERETQAKASALVLERTVCAR